MTRGAERSIRILIAEDDERAREVLAARLTAAGMETETCQDGAAALELARRIRPDAIVSDALMPRVNGFQLCQMLRRDECLCSVAFILYTATYTEDEDRALAMRSGADALVVKPDESGALIDVIRTTVSRVRTQPARLPETSDPTLAFFDDYARRMAAKLELKVQELRHRNDALRASEVEVRALNARLAQTVGHLEREVCERRRVEDVLKLAEEVAQVGSLSIDAAAGGNWCSGAAAALLGLTAAERDQFAIEMLLDKVTPAQADELRRLTTASSPVDRDVGMEVEATVADESEPRALHVRSRLFRDARGAPLRRIWTLHDISSRRRAQEKADAMEHRLRQSQKLEALGNLAGGIAHDFNNILTAILSHAEMQQVGLESATDSEGVLALESAKEIERASLRARDLVSQILTFSRRQRVERVALDPAPVVAEALRMIKASAPATVVISEHLASAGSRILANAGQWHQVVVNLLTNAVQALGESGGELRVRLVVVHVSAAFAELHPPLVAGPAVQLDVIDTGIGMDAVTVTRVFEPFFTTRAKTNGTGLGLAVVHGIVDDGGGAIVVSSDVGHGTSFSVYLPLVRENVSTFTRSTRLPTELTTGRGERVMLVDDEPSVTRIGIRMLTHLGYQVEAFNDPAAAIDVLRRRHPEFELVLTDRAMPRVSGELLCAAVRALQTDLPVVLMTAFGDGMDQHDVRTLGFHALLSKPFTLNTLAAMCARAVAR